MHNDPCDNHDGLFDQDQFDRERAEIDELRKKAGLTVTFRISYLIRHIDRADEIVRTTFDYGSENMAEALAEWHRIASVTSGAAPPGALVFACTVADHPRMHAKRRCESMLGGGRCILVDGHRTNHEFS